MQHAFRSIISVAALAVASAALAACGGGGPSGGGSSGTALVTGQLVSVNGTTSNLGGVKFTMPSTGKTVTTAPNGSFSFGYVPAGTITLKVGGPGSALTAGTVTPQGEQGNNDNGTDATPGSDDASEAQDATDSDPNDDGDSHDVGDDDADVSGIADGEDVQLTVELVNGVITAFNASHTHHHELQAEMNLQRSVESDDPDVEGSAKVEARDDGQRVKVNAHHLTTGRGVELFLINKDGGEESEGSRTTDLNGNVEWIADTSHGDALPFGVTSVADLIGFGVEVRDAGNGLVLLFGTVPADLPVSTDQPGEPGSHEGCGQGRVRLTNADGVLGEAHVAIKSRPDENREEFHVDAEHRTAGTSIKVWLEDPNHLGTLNLIGTMTVGAEGEADLELDTHNGDLLPYGVAAASTLTGMHVELRDSLTDALLYSGIVPALVAN